MSASEEEIERALARRDADVAELVREAEQAARADALETLRRLIAGDLLRRAAVVLGARPLVMLAGVGDGIIPLVLELGAGDLEDEARLEHLVRAHNELLMRALEAGAVLPFRFGTTFPDRGALDDWVARHRAEISAELERLRGTSEWSVEVVARADETDPSRYLEARLATAVRPDVRERLAAASVDAAEDAYLVADARRDAFVASIAELEAEGYELRVTGPWPPYSFARLA